MADRAPQTHPCWGGLDVPPPPSPHLSLSVSSPFTLFLRDGRGVSVDKNHLLSCLDLGRDSVIPSPWPARRAGGKEQRRRRGIDFQIEGMRRIELRCVAETGVLKGVLHSRGKQTSVAYSAGQLEPEQVPPMLINGLFLFFPQPHSLVHPQYHKLNLTRRCLDKKVTLLKALK